SNGAGCTYLKSGAYYTVQSSDTGSTIRLAFSVSNAYGSAPVSMLTQPVGASPPPSPPTNTSPPTVSGTAEDGQTLAASTGSWSGSPASYAYQWQHCDSYGGACSGIAGATGPTYLVQPTDVGSTLRVAVTASNSAGSTSAFSAVTGLVNAAP